MQQQAAAVRLSCILLCQVHWMHHVGYSQLVLCLVKKTISKYRPQVYETPGWTYA
jgi:hypothetical protein